MFKWIWRFVQLLLAFFSFPLLIVGIVLSAVLAIGLVLFAVLGGAGNSGSPGTNLQNTVSAAPSGLALTQIGSVKLSLVMQMASQSSCGNPWQVLAAIGRIEDSSFGTVKAIGPALNNYDTKGVLISVTHAYGPAQFLIPTYASIDGSDPPQTFVRDERGVLIEQRPPDSAHIWQPEFAYKAMDVYLCQNHAGTDLSAALFAYNHSQAYVDSVLKLAVQYTAAPPIDFGPVQCSRNPSNRLDFGQALATDFRIFMPGFDLTHQQWVWEELCRFDTTKFPGFIAGARVELTSQSDTHQVGCPPSVSVKLGEFSDKVTSDYAFAHEFGHVVFNCYIRNGKNLALELEFIRANLIEGGISYYAQHAKSCTGSDNYSEDSADTIAYYLIPNLPRNLVRCENNRNTIPDLSKFPLHMAWAQKVLSK